MRTVTFLFFASAPLILSLLTTHAVSAAELSCEIADELAGKAYTRAANAKNGGNLVAAHQHKLAFWDVFQHGSHCVNVKTMAIQLSAKKLGAGDDPPSGQEAFRSIAGTGGLNLPPSCFSGGALACRIIVTEPPKGNTAGVESNPNFYILDEGSLSKRLPSGPAWKKFAGPKIELPMSGEFKR